jgi:hypothetical protein
MDTEAHMYTRIFAKTHQNKRVHTHARVAITKYIFHDPTRTASHCLLKCLRKTLQYKSLVLVQIPCALNSSFQTPFHDAHACSPARSQFSKWTIPTAFPLKATCAVQAPASIAGSANVHCVCASTAHLVHPTCAHAGID